MPVFAYEAVTAAGEVVDGRVEAADRSEALRRLRDLGYLPLKAWPAATTAPAATRGLRMRRGAPRRGEVALVMRGLATLLGAGVPLERALALMSDEAASPGQRALLTAVHGRIKAGGTLADALAEQGGVVPGHAVAMIRAGEAGGDLATVLARLADLMERAAAAREHVRAALAYPALLLAVAGLTVVVLLTVVLPQFEGIFAEAGDRLPAGTRLVVAVGEALRAWWWVGGVAMAVALAILDRWRRTAAGARAMGRWLLTAPVAGRLVAANETARFCRTLGTLVANGVHLLQAVAIARETVANVVVAEALGAAEISLRRGGGLGEPLARCAVLPPLAVRLIRIGEESGHLAAMLLKVADIFEDQARRDTQRLLALLVPGLTVALGLVVAAVVGAVLSAVLSVYDLPL